MKNGMNKFEATLVARINDVRFSDRVVTGLDTKRTTRWSSRIGAGITVSDVAAEVWNDLGAAARWVTEALNHDERLATETIGRCWELAKLNLEAVLEGNGGLLNNRLHKEILGIHAEIVKAEAA